MLTKIFSNSLECHFVYSVQTSHACVFVRPAGRNALHVDVHMSSGFIYWCDFSSTVASQNGIRRIKPDGSGFRSIITSGIGRNGIRGIAVDWAAGENVHLMHIYVDQQLHRHNLCHNLSP